MGDTRSLAEAETVRGTVLLWADAPDKAVAVLEEAVTLAEETGALDTLSTALLSLHWTYILRGEFDRVRECGERGVAVAGKAGDTDALALHTSNTGLRLFYLGDWREARTHLERGGELTRSTPPSLFSCVPLAYLGVLCQAEGRGSDSLRRGISSAVWEQERTPGRPSGRLEPRA